MEESDRRRRDRLVVFLDRADQDISFAYAITRDTWGIAQANRYLDFLLVTCQKLANNDTFGQVVESQSGLWVYFARISKRRMSHGHKIFYRTMEDGIEIVRVLHTASNWIGELEELGPESAT